MVSFTILGGGYSTFVATYTFTIPSPSTNGTLTVTGRSPTGMNPSWLSLNPKNQSQLYTVNEISPGALQSYSITKAGTLTPLVQSVSSGGDSPAFVTALASGAVGVVNYMSGTGRIVPTTVTSQNFDDSAPVITFPLPSTSAISHPHQLVEYNNDVYIPDLGLDTIWILQASKNGSYAIQGQIPQPKGSGPRHITFYNDRLYTLHELSSTLSVSTIPRTPKDSVKVISTVSIIPPNPPAGSKWQAAEIIIPPLTPKFPKPYIYVSNRNTGQNQSLTPGDSIAIYELVGQGTSMESLKLVKHVYTGLEQVRGMLFGKVENGSEDYLVAAGVVGTGGTIVLKRVDGGRDLQIVARNTEVPTRTSFVWL